MSSNIEIINRQRKHTLDAERWRAFTVRTLSEVKRVTNSAAKNKRAKNASEGATVVFAGEALIRRLNRDFRGVNRVTDVLSFPSEQSEFESAASPSAGDIVICTKQAARQAKEHDMTFNAEIAQLILHGLLHLHGYDHTTDEGEMNELEMRLRLRLGI
ncbi:MAG: rRNA maturation RNase YbeY [Pyrinomonadaceae bacterium MAG19_C2-C3]|nr:rRNA maturation RNase YbeY [Pyrinomonadaceae bacterium MAG19_C2-C3]